MASDQNMTQAITKTAIEAAKAAIMAVGEAEVSAKSRRPAHAVLRASGPALKKLTFEWKAQDKYNELCSIKITIRNTFLMNN